MSPTISSMNTIVVILAIESMLIELMAAFTVRVDSMGIGDGSVGGTT